MADWSRRFFDPIDLPNGRQLETLRDAANYITALPASEHDLPHWRAAIEALILSAEHGERGADPMLARIGITRALNPHVERVFEPSGKKHHWGKRKLARDR
jgi:hypothetical protein